MKKINFSKTTRSDIVSIGRYSERMWGKEQRDLYIHKLFAAFEQLCASPHLGKPCDEIYIGMRLFRVEKHVIYYFIEDKILYIAGVLHQSMLPEGRF